MTAAAILLAASPAVATILKPLNLDDLVRSADRIFSGTVVEIEKSSVAMGGGNVPIVIYRVLLDAAFRGEFPEKGGGKIAEIRMVANQPEARSNGLTRLPRLTGLPEFEQGKRYLFFMTKPSAAGLSAPVGLGQGFFHVSGSPGSELVVNGFDNLGLFRGMNVPEASGRGPVKYDVVVRRITALGPKK